MRGQKCIHELRSDPVEVHDPLFDDIAVEKPESSLLCPEFTFQGTLVGKEGFDPIGQRASEIRPSGLHEISSPGPIATSRRGSTPTLVEISVESGARCPT